MNHFALEDTQIFPGLEFVKGAPKGKLPHEPKQRQAFKSNIQIFITHCGSTKGEDYDSTKFRALINTFAEPFVSHLHSEILVLLDLDVCDEAGSKALLAVIDKGEEAAAMQDKFIVPPMVMGLCDNTFKGEKNWPGLPFGTGYVINYVLSWKHQGAWRFLPSDHWRTPRPLAFGPELVPMESVNGEGRKGNGGGYEKEG